MDDAVGGVGYASESIFWGLSRNNVHLNGIKSLVNDCKMILLHVICISDLPMSCVISVLSRDIDQQG
jgi:hypothetical protein